MRFLLDALICESELLVNAALLFVSLILLGVHSLLLLLFLSLLFLFSFLLISVKLLLLVDKSHASVCYLIKTICTNCAVRTSDYFAC